ncbi:MAG: acetyl-CoA carboxylase carboxyl transferase subunit alpha, partial [Spirochaetota bacterium]|nr:acetyl-CoA carboxylase carboxyl transferase subunit alpha [Spirochaetota bacterium]
MAVELSFEGPIIELDKKIEDLKKLDKQGNVSFRSEISKLESKRENLLKEIYNNLTPWQITQVARHPERPQFFDYINYIFKNFIEL